MSFLICKGIPDRGEYIMDNEMQSTKMNKNQRVLDMYARLCEGKLISKAEESLRFGVDERSIQRDVDDIRAFLNTREVADATDQRKINYNRIKKGYEMIGCEGSMMSNSEILAVSKILLESRAFTKDEIDSILNKMIAGCVPLKNMKLVSDLIANEKFHYVELHHQSHIHEKLWELGEEIQKHNLIELLYQKQVYAKEIVKRIVQPVAVLFSEYYFYLNAYIVEKDDKGKFVHKYDYPAIFRLDRIVDYKEIGDKFSISYADRFEEGEFRKRIQFMFPGKLIKLQFKYIGVSAEAILDRLPTARVLSEKEGSFVIEAEVYGKGILMWLLSQGSRIEVLKPETMRTEIKKILLDALEHYKD